MNSTRLALFLLVVLAVVGMTTCTTCSSRIDAGNEGILVKQYGSSRGVQDVSLVTGRVWYNPLTEDVYEFPTFVQTLDYEPFTVNARDGSVFNVDPTVSIRVIPGKSPAIFKKYRKGIEAISESVILNYVKDAFRIQFNNYTTDSLISHRQSFENAVQKQLHDELQKEGFALEQMTSGLHYPESITQAINAKNAAVQQAMRVENELRITEANSRKQVVQAEADGKALLLRAEAEAKAYELRQRNLTPLLIQQQFIEKWDGKLPTYGTVPQVFKQIQ